MTTLSLTYVQYLKVDFQFFVPKISSIGIGLNAKVITGLIDKPFTRGMLNVS